MAASVSTSGATVTFTGESGEEAIARSTVSTTSGSTAVTFKFEVRDDALVLRVGTTAGAQDIVNETRHDRGYHVITFTPGQNTYYVEWVYRGILTAKLVGFAAVSAGVLELETPWDDAALASIQYDQSLNVVYLFDGRDQGRVLERRGNTSWSLRLFEPQTGPWRPDNLSDITMTPSGQQGRVTVTASRPVFRASDVGGMLRLTHPGQNEIANLAALDAVTGSIKVTGVENGRQFAVVLTGTWSGTVTLERSIGNDLSFQAVESYTTNTNKRITDELDNVIAYYRLRMTAYTSGSAAAELAFSAGVTDGWGRIAAVGADNAATVDVLEPFGRGIATTLWAFSEFGGRFGHPAAVAFHDGRLWLGRRNQYFASDSDNFETFSIGPEPDNAISKTLPGPMNAIIWMRGGQELLIGATGAEFVVGSGSFDEPIMPINVRARRRTDRGSYSTRPAMVDDHAVFVSRSQQRLYRMAYNSDRGEYDAAHLTRLNRELGRASGYRRIAFQREPEPRLWILREDGSVVVWVYDLEEGVVAPCRLIWPDAKIVGVCVLPNSPEDEVYLAVRRGNSIRLEQIADEEWTDVRQAWRLVSAVEYVGDATDTFSGLDHLEDRPVYVWGDGRQQGPFTVSGGAITIGAAVARAIVGEAVTGEYISARLAYGGEGGSALTAQKSLSRLGLLLYRTALSVVSYGDSWDRLDTPPVTDLVDYDAPVEVVTLDESYPLDGSRGSDPRLHIRMDGAGPAEILALIPHSDADPR